MSSTTIDSKVVEMKFDNSKFEKGVKETLSTLDKLKLAISNLKGNNLEINTNSATSNVGALSNTVEAVGEKFNALEKLATGALYKIGSQAVTAGEQLLKSLTVDQLSAGYSKYDEKTTSVQTLVNSTGKSVEEINGYLERLMWYSDETSYSFTEMVSALAQMTSTGGDIENLIPTITGIANATAFAGKGAQEFVHTIRNLGQSYTAGYLQLMDWKSLNLAGTSSKQLTEELIKAAEELGTIKKGTVDLTNFTDKLKDKVITTEVMEKAFSRFSAMSDEAYRLVNEGVFDTASEAIEAIGDDFDELAYRAFRSAQEAKTFKEAIDATKDAVSSGWMKTYELIFGNYEQAKDLWTDLANGMWDFFAGGAEDRNKLLSQALGDEFDSLSKMIGECGVSTEMFEASLEKTAKAAGYDVDFIKEHWGSMGEYVRKTGEKSDRLIRTSLHNLLTDQKGLSTTTESTVGLLEKYQKAVDGIVKGNYGTGAERMKKLAEAGYDAAGAQKLVNMVYKRGNNTFKDTTITAEDLSKVLKDMTVEEAELVGLTDEQKTKLIELLDTGTEAGATLEDLIARLGTGMSGREMLIDSVKNTLAGLVNLLGMVKSAFAEAFGTITEGQLYGSIKNMYDLSKAFREWTENEDNVAKITNLFIKLFGIIHKITKIATGVFKFAWNTILTIFRYISPLIYAIVDGISGCADNFLSLFEITEDGNPILDTFGFILGTIVDWFSKLLEKTKFIPSTFEKIVGVFKKVKGAFEEWIVKLKESDNVALFILQSIVYGLIEGATWAVEQITNFGTMLLNALFTALGVGQKNDEYKKAGSDAMDEFVRGFEERTGKLVEALKTFGTTVIDTIKKLPWGKLMAAGIAISMVVTTSSLAKSVSKIVKVLAPVQSILNAVEGLVSQIKSTIKDIGKSIKTAIAVKSFEMVAETVLALAAAFFILNNVVKNSTPGQIATTSVILGLMLGAIAAIMWEFGQINNEMARNRVKPSAMLQVTSMLKGISGIIITLSILGLVIKGMERPEQLMYSIIAIFAGLTWLLAALADGMESAKKTDYLDMVKYDEMLQNVAKILKSVALLLITFSICAKIMSTISSEQWTTMRPFLIGIGTFILLVIGLTKIPSKDSSKDIYALSVLMDAIGLAMLLLAGAFKIIEGIDPKSLSKGIGILTEFFVVCGILITIAVLANGKLNDSLKSIGIMAAGLAFGFTAVALALSIIANVDQAKMGQILKVLFTFVSVLAIAAVVSKKAIKVSKDLAIAMAAFAGSIVLMIFAIKMLGKIKPEILGKGVISVGILGAIIVALIAVCGKWNSEGKGIALAIISLAAAINMLVLAVFLLGEMPEEVAVKGIALVAALGVIVGLIMFAFKKFDGKGIVSTAVGIAAVMAVAVAAIAIIALLPAEDAKRATNLVLEVSLGIAAMVFTLALTAKWVNNEWKNIAGIGVVIVGLLVIIYSLSFMFKTVADAANLNKDVDKITQSMVGMMIGAIASLIILMVIVKAVEEDQKLLLGGAATIALMAGFLASIAGFLYLLSKIKTYNIDAMKQVGLMMLELCGVLVVLMIVGEFIVATEGEAGLAGLIGLGALDIILAAIIGTLAALSKVDPNMVSAGLAIIEMVATGFGKAVGGFEAGRMENLDRVGDTMASFFEKLKPFFDSLEKYDVNIFDVVANMSKTIKSFLKIGDIKVDPSKWDGISVNLSNLAKQMVDFIDSFAEVKEVDVKKVTNIVDAATEAAKLEDIIPRIGGLREKFLGENMDMTELGQQIVDLTKGLNLAGYYAGTVNADKLHIIADAASAFADIFENLPKHDGYLQDWIGTTYTLKEFGDDMVVLAQGMKGFNDNIKNVEKYNFEKGADMAARLAEIANALPDKDGIAQSIFGGGTTTLDTFGAQLGKFGSALYTFSNSTKYIEKGKTDDAIEIGLGVAKIAQALVGTDTAYWSEGGTIGYISEKLGPLGEALNTYYTNVSTISWSSMSTINTQIENLVTTLAKCSEVKKQDVDDFRIALEALGNLNVDSLINAFSNRSFDGLTGGLSDFIEAIIVGIGNKHDALVVELNSVFNTLIDYVQDTYYNRFRSIGWQLMEQMGGGISGENDYVVNAAKTVIYNARSAALKLTTLLFHCGKEFSTQVANGISSSESKEKVTHAAKVIAEQAKAAFNEVMKNGSTETTTTESFTTFAIKQLEELGKQAQTTSETVQSSFENVFEDSFNSSNILDYIDVDMNPVITPSLDLSEVENEAGRLDRILSRGRVGIIGELGQNGEDSEITPTTYSFVQNNYSPKALSKIDIYRQTKNLISVARG